MIGTTVSRYRILSKLGGGGMGIVYEAEDLELGRRVALKFLPDDTADNPEALERFKREVRAASALNHPHICTVYDVGRHEGRPFLIMERMSGRTLRQILDEQKLTVERVIELGEQIADGLDAAHRAGIIHRDLKPTNLFVTDRDEIKILDFGMAKVLGAGVAAEPSPLGGTSSPDPEHHTSPGMVVGTVAYMSPEQAKGEAVDARSDLFALGIVLYRMASGRMPFLSVSTGEFFRALLADQPVPLQQLDPAIPVQLDEIVRKCLEKDPALRYQTAADVRADLKRLRRDGHSKSGMVAAAVPPPESASRRPRLLLWGGIAGASAALISIALVALWPERAGRAAAGALSPSGAAGTEKRIAVLPFENLGNPDDAYFAEGMSDEIQSKLAGLPGLTVIARGSTLEYRGTTKRPDVIARELGVRYLLTATVRWQRAGSVSRIRVTPALVEVAATKGERPVTRWQETYDAELEDVFEVQGRIATQVAQALEVALGSEQERRMEARPTSNLAAYDAYLKGREILLRGNDTQTQREASVHFERAVALDPEFALAWVQLGVARSLVYANGVRTPEQKESARGAAARALELQPESPDAHWAMAVFLRLAASESTSALTILQRGLELAPDDVNLLRNLGLARRELGRVKEALEPMRRAEQLDPRNLLNKVALSGTLLRLHLSKEAREVADRGLELVPGNYDLVLYKMLSHLQEGDLAGAQASLANLPREVDRTAMVAYFASSGNRLWALEPSLRDLLLNLEPGAFGGDRAIWAGALAGDLWLRGRFDEAKRYAEEASQGFAAWIEESPEVAILHAELGSALAILGRADEAVREGERAVELAPLDEDSDNGSEALHSLVLIHLQLGQTEEAIDDLERVLKAPYWVTPAWLRIDPTYDSLRGNPRFEKLAAGPP